MLRPAIGRLWSELVQRSNKEEWPAACFLGALMEHELVERAKLRIDSHRAEAQLDTTQTLASCRLTRRHGADRWAARRGYGRGKPVLWFFVKQLSLEPTLAKPKSHG